MIAYAVGAMLAAVLLSEQWSVPDDYPLGVPRGAAFSRASGLLYTWDVHQPVVHVFRASDGLPLSTFGTEGEGPGDLSGRILSVVAFGDGRVGVLATQSGLSVYDRTGRFLETWFRNDHVERVRFAHLSGEHLLLDRLVREGDTPGYESHHKSIVLWSRDFGFGEKLAETHYTYGPGNNELVEVDAAFVMDRDVGTDGRVYLARTWDRYEIEVIDPDGTVSYWRDPRATPLARTSTQLAQLADRLNSEPSCDQCPGFTWDFADNHAAIQELYVGDDGALRVLPASGAFEEGCQTWDVWIEGARHRRERVEFPYDPAADRAFWVAEDHVLLIDNAQETASDPIRIRMFKNASLPDR